jgi:tetraacyldisaccharide 4'-kinase
MLSQLAWVYGHGVAARNYLYDRGIFDVHDLGVRAISVGNITVGGTGKTPLVAYVARLLAEQGEKVCILTRGYGREDESKRILVSDRERILVRADTGGDEPVELANKLLGEAIVIADADRVGAAEWARRKFGLTAFVLDDGFQHRKVKRDVDIVCVDATDPFGGGRLLPAGRLRERVTNLARADVIVITRVEQVNDVSDLRSRISDIAPGATIVECRTHLTKIREMTEPNNGLDPNVLSVRSYFAFCGLGSPNNFFHLLRQNSIDPAGTRSFRDHHPYTQEEIEDIEQNARRSGANALITTAKDVVKLWGLDPTLPCDVAEIDVKIDDADRFKRALSR